MSSIAIITARGGSKRIPRKNIKEFCGKPIIAYSIEAALESGIFDEVMVSTDDEEIAQIAIKYGAKVPFMRSEKTANDFATTADVLLEVLDVYKQNGQEFDYMCCIYPTAPFVTATKLQNAMNLIKENDVAEVLPVVAFSFPPQRGFVVNEASGLLEYATPEFANYRSQDLPSMYHDAGQFYAYNISKYLEKNGQIRDNMMPIEMPEIEVQDIDNEMDWKLAEVKYKLMKQDGN